VKPLALSRAYPSVFQQPVIRAVDPAIFRYSYFTHCMSCGFCKDQCCSYGVDIDVENMTRLMALGPELEPLVGTPAAEWFTDEMTKDREFPGGASGRTAVRDGACIFLDREKRGCKIHAYCLDNDIDYHRLKPIVSTLFPLTFEGGVLTVSGEVEDGSLVCLNQGPVIYDGVRGELEYYFGAAFVAEIDALRARL
jgi:hypothetical protein